MLNRKSVLASFTMALAMVSMASAADMGNSRVSYAGGHNAVNLVRFESQTNTPYALTGNEMTTQSTNLQPIYLGSRFAGMRSVGR